MTDQAWYRAEVDRIRKAAYLIAQRNGVAREDCREMIRDSVEREVSHLRRRVAKRGELKAVRSA